MTQTIELIVTPQGETKIETKGFTGSSCREASKFIEAALGKLANERLTNEFFVATTSPQIQQSQRP